MTIRVAQARIALPRRLARGRQSGAGPPGRREHGDPVGGLV
jgi:hypothetical protein